MAINVNLVRVDDYAKKTIDGVTKICATTHGVRVNPSHISRVVEAGTGYDENGENPTDVYRVVFINGLSIFTDTDGLNDIDDRAKAVYMD